LSVLFTVSAFLLLVDSLSDRFALNLIWLRPDVFDHFSRINSDVHRDRLDFINLSLR
jgi:hypothetical protein